LLSSTLSLLEVKRKLKKDNISVEKISKVVQFMTQRSIVMDVTQEISEMASDISLSNDLPVVDSIMYTTASLNKSILVTGDPQYKNIKNTVVIS
jgi:predicted nucleic acid-binding protein